MLTLTVFSVATRCLGFIYKIYLTKIMTTTDLGIYNITLSIFMVLLTIVGSSIPLTISKITAKNNSLGKNSRSSHSVTSATILNLIIALIICGITLCCKPLINTLIGDENGYIIIISLLPSIIFTAIYSGLKGYMWGLENYFSVSIVEFVEQILKIALCFVFILSNLFLNPVLAVAQAMNISCGLSTLLGVYLYLKNSGRFSYKKGYFKEIIISSTPLTFVRLLSSLIMPLITIIIPLRLVSPVLTRSEILSDLGVLMGMTMPLLSIPSTIIGALCMILIPKISGENKEQINNGINYYILFTISCIFLFIPAYMVLGKPICEYIFSNTQAGIYLSQQAWIMLPIGLSQISTSVLNALSLENRTFLYFIISNSALIIFTLIFTPLLGSGILVVGMGLSASITALLNFIQIKKKLGTKTRIMSLTISHILLSIPVILITTYTYNILSKYLSQLSTIALSGTISVVSFISLLFVFDIINFGTLKGYLKRAKPAKSSHL